MCAFGDQDATGVINDVIEDVASGQESHEGSRWRGNAKYVESLRVPDWVFLFFKTTSNNFWPYMASGDQQHSLWKNGKVFHLFVQNYNTVACNCVLRFVF